MRAPRRDNIREHLGARLVLSEFGKFRRFRQTIKECSIVALMFILLLFAFLIPVAAGAVTATYYDGYLTASGDYMHSGSPWTCASPLYPDGTPYYPMGSKLLIIDNETGKRHQCRVTDTGDMADYGYGVDLSYRLAEHFGLTTGKGVTDVTIVYLYSDPNWYYGKQY